METILYWLARALIALLQRLPLRIVARLGRAGGWVAWILDRRHRRVALGNLAASFVNELTQAQIRALARENFLRLGENYACAVRTAAMNDDEIRQVLEVRGAEKISDAVKSDRSLVGAIGHFGNFELYTRVAGWTPGLQFATTYRALSQPRLNALLQRLRERSGCLFFERRTEASALRAAMSRQQLVIGFLADQHGGDRGLRVPFLNRECSTNVAPAVFALRYGCPLAVAICYRIALGRWRIEIGDPIPTHVGAHPRPVLDITLDINRAFETAVRRDPANWFWVHRRWKPGKGRPLFQTPDAQRATPNS